ncbi:hypothetical protein GGR56DRAFT_682765 [Xylariaceae sp. FL0804]|nr:hypothetical protein GGR56DRAFT_682765 [Xylariaceae sp. FL0804]
MTLFGLWAQREAKWNTSRHSLGLYRSVIVTCRYTLASPALFQHGDGGRRPPLREAVEHALARVVMRHGGLRVGIAGEDTPEPAFVRLRTIDLRRMLEWVDMPASSASELEEGEEEGHDDRLLRSLERLHEQLWEDLPNKPGWKVVVHHHDARQPATAAESRGEEPVVLDVAFCFHHAYADGKSAYIFHRDLRDALNSAPSAGVPLPAEFDAPTHTLRLDGSPPPPLPPPLEALVPLTVSWRFFLRTLWAQLLYPALVPAFVRRLLNHLAPRSLPWTAGPITPTPATARLRLVAVPPERLAGVLDACRARGATLTGLLHALLARSLATRLSSAERSKKEEADDGSRRGNLSFSGTTPISLERYVKPGLISPRLPTPYVPGETLHCLVTACTSDFSATAVDRLLLRASSPSSGAATATATAAGRPTEEAEEEAAAVWDVAGAVTAQLRARLGTLPGDDALALLPYVRDWPAFFRAKFGGPRANTWEVSNIGSLPGLGPEKEKSPGEGAAWQIDRAIFTQGAAPVSAAIQLGVAGVAKRGVDVSLSWQEGVVDDALADGVVADLRRWLRALGASGRLGA